MLTSRAFALTVLTTSGLLLASPLAATAQSRVSAISVTGEASVSVPPDLAEVNGGVTNDAKTAREASDANNKAMAGVLAALKSAGIADADIRTSRLSLQPQTAQPRSGSNSVQIVGYRASNRVTVRVRDVSKVANTLDTLVAAGANDIGGIDFMVLAASKLLDTARTEAIADARRKAEIYARAAGVSLGAPLSIAESGAAMPTLYRGVSAGIASAPVAQGEETLHVNVSVSWEIKPPTP